MTTTSVKRDFKSLAPEQKRAIRQQQLRRGSVYVLAIVIMLWIVLPIWLIAVLAFSENAYAYPKPLYPQPFSTETMDFFLSARNVTDSAKNSVIVALLTLLLSTAISAPAGYAISRYLFRGRNAFRLSILAVRAFPIVTLAVPIAVMYKRYNMYDTLYGVALMHTALTLPTTVLVISSVFASIPVEMEEAAKVFGASPIQAFFRIVFPLTLPGIAAASIFTFVMSWNEVFAAILLTIENRTLPAQILFALDKSSLEFKAAGGFFMLVPALVFIFFIRRYLFNMWGQLTK